MSEKVGGIWDLFMGKASLGRHAQLPTNLTIEAIKYLKTMRYNEGLHIISQVLNIQEIEVAGVIERVEGVEHIEGAEEVEGAEDI